MAWLKVCLVIVTLMAVPNAAFAVIGKVLRVSQGAEVTRAGKTVPLREGMEVASGDAIATNRTGLVQLLFVDETKIAVGPNAQMVLDVSMLRGGRKAKNFTVRALGGSFRFISGKSRKRAYAIKTPSATMAVRGTTFDMWITSGDQSAMLVIEGAVRMCGSGGSCRSASRQCSMFATSAGGAVGRPADRVQYDKALKGGFPFIQSQQGLLPAFQADSDGCRDGAVRRVRQRVETDPPERNRPAPAPVRRAGQVKAVAKAAKPKEPEREERREPEREERREPEREERREPEREDRTEARSEASPEREAGAQATAGEVSASAGSEGDDKETGARATATAGNVTAVSR